MAKYWVTVMVALTVDDVADAVEAENVARSAVVPAANMDGVVAVFASVTGGGALPIAD